VRERIQTGDVLLFVGRGPISRLIRWGSDARYSHCGIASWEDGRLMLFHAAIHGVKHVRAGDSVDRYDGRVDWWTLRPDLDDALDRDGIIEQARHHLGKPFAILEMMRLTWQIARGRYRGTPDPEHPPEAMFCSWYVSRCYRVGGGVDLVPDASDECTTPAQLEHSELLVHRGTLHT
jgi:hypothetical protein